MTLGPLKFYPNMKFHFNSTSAPVELELLQIEKCDVRTDKRTYLSDRGAGGQTADGEVIPKCHLCLQQVTQTVSVELSFKGQS